VRVDQSPIGRTPRSNPATYTGVFDKIRTLFAATTEAKCAGTSRADSRSTSRAAAARACSGDGTIKIEMNFLPDVCAVRGLPGRPVQTGKPSRCTTRARPSPRCSTWSIEDAAEFFKPITSIHRYLQTLGRRRLGYVRLGQPAPTLSGGEAQRVKLASSCRSGRPVARCTSSTSRPRACTSRHPQAARRDQRPSRQGQYGDRDRTQTWT